MNGSSNRGGGSTRSATVSTTWANLAGSLTVARCRLAGSQGAEVDLSFEKTSENVRIMCVSEVAWLDCAVIHHTRKTTLPTMLDELAWTFADSVLSIGQPVTRQCRWRPGWKRAAH